jgi:ferrochelatase
MKTAALLVGFGGPRSLAEVEPMLTAVFGATPPPPMLAAACRKYEAIGGSSPLVTIAGELAALLPEAFAHAGLAVEYVQPGMCFTPPSITAALENIAAAGYTRVCYLSMTPFHSQAAWGRPLVTTIEAALPFDLEVLPVPPVGLFAPYCAGQVAAIEAALAALPGSAAPEAASAPALAPSSFRLLFVAHALPLDDPQEAADTYEQELTAAAARIVAALDSRLGLDLGDYALAYTSRGVRGARWSEPSLEAVLHDSAQARRAGVLICPLGFATDHMEVLYDLDLDGRECAESLGLHYARAATLNTAPALLDAYAAAVSAYFAATPTAVPLAPTTPTAAPPASAPAVKDTPS